MTAAAVDASAFAWMSAMMSMAPVIEMRIETNAVRRPAPASVRTIRDGWLDSSPLPVMGILLAKLISLHAVVQM